MQNKSNHVFIKMYIMTLCVFVIIDFVWLGIISPTFYEKHLGYLMSESVNLIAVSVFYMLYAYALTVFVIEPACTTGSRKKAVTYGALFGLVTYGTYDLTNQAVIANWPIIVTVVDMVWGMIITLVTSYIVSTANMASSKK